MKTTKKNTEKKTSVKPMLLMVLLKGEGKRD